VGLINQVNEYSLSIDLDHKTALKVLT